MDMVDDQNASFSFGSNEFEAEFAVSDGRDVGRFLVEQNVVLVEPGVQMGGPDMLRYSLTGTTSNAGFAASGCAISRLAAANRRNTTERPGMYP